jgi:colanic acid/amylovoran biosynthesis glycosyltransferase
MPSDEWRFSRWQVLLAAASMRSSFYQNFLKRRLKNDLPHVAHAHFGNVATAYLSVLKSLKIPLAVSFYGYDYQSVMQRNLDFRQKYAELFEYASAVICLGAFAKKHLLNLGCPAKKIHAIRLAIDPLEVPFSERKKPARSLRLLQVGTFTEKKGHFYTLRAFAAALKTCPDMTLTLLGEKLDNGIVPQLQRFIAENDLSDHVHLFDNMLTYSELCDHFQNFDAFIHPSITAENGDCEGTPVVLMDAQASGLPAISTFHSDIPEVVLHEKTGLLTPEKDVPGLAAAIRRFYEMGEEEYAQFGRQARGHIEANFDVRRSGERLKQLYLQISGP